MGGYSDGRCLRSLCIGGSGFVARRTMGLLLPVSLVAVNLLGDVLNVFLGTEPRAVIGIPIALAILAFLMSRRARRFFLGK